jgi:hypothetical protein
MTTIANCSDNNTVSVNNSFASAAGEALLAPLQLCGSKWNSLSAKDNSETLDKTDQIAQNIILGVLLSIATALAFIPGVIGSILKSSSHAPVEEGWKLQLDEQLKSRCEQVGIDNPEVSDLSIEVQVARNCEQELPLAISSVKASRPGHLDVSRIISLQTAGPNYPFFKNLISCFHPPLTADENALALQELPDHILGVSREPSSNSKSLLLNKIASCNAIDIGISPDLKFMIIQTSH